MKPSVEFTPKPHQLKIMEWVYDHPRCAIFAAMGSGKTVSVLTALQDLKSVTNKSILVIAPLQVAKNTWPGEIKKWEHFKYLSTSLLLGTPAERDSAFCHRGDVCVINYENLPWLIEKTGSLFHRYFHTIIVDESTRLKGFRLRQGSARAKALAKVAHTQVERIVLLTGTPASNGLKDLWGQHWFVDRGVALGRTYSEFADRWFYEDYSGFNLIPKTCAQEEIQNALKATCISISPSECGTTDTPVTNKIMLELPSKVRKLYKQMEKEMFLSLKSGDIEAMNAASKTIKCHQIANGAIYLEDKTYEVIHDEKILALESVIEEANGMPVLVAYHFKSDLARLQRAFPTGRVLGDRSTNLEDWNSGKISILFVYPKTGGIGLNLANGSNILVFFSVDWSLEDHDQMVERIGCLRQKQAGLNRPVFVYYLLMRETIDETITERLETKKSVQEVLLNALKKVQND